MVIDGLLGSTIQQQQFLLTSKMKELLAPFATKRTGRPSEKDETHVSPFLPNMIIFQNCASADTLIKTGAASRFGIIDASRGAPSRKPFLNSCHD